MSLYPFFLEKELQKFFFLKRTTKSVEDGTTKV